MPDQNIEACPVCEQPLQPGDVCATDIELGTSHAECLAGAPVVDLNTGEELPESELNTFRFRYGDMSIVELELDGNQLLIVPPPTIHFHDAEGSFVTIKSSGEVILREGLEISDAARRFWKQLAETFPSFKAGILAETESEQKQEPVAVKVKPLEWIDGYAFCDPINSGFYHITYMQGRKAWFVHGVGMPGGFSELCRSEGKARAAAQADHECRIRSEIEPAPDLSAENARLRRENADLTATVVRLNGYLGLDAPAEIAGGDHVQAD